MKNYFKSYVWLIETLLSRGPQTLKEIKSLWLCSSVNENGKELATRTFTNHVNAIADIFGIDIVCDRRYNTYYIENMEDIGGNKIGEWMLDALCLNSLLNESASLRGRVIFENVPSGRMFLATIIRAIRDSKKLEIRYKSYRKSEEEKFIVDPYFLKEFKRRWYLYGYKGDADGPHMFALDRMIKVDDLTEDFTMPKEFVTEDYFAGVYGARIYPDMKKEAVRLKVYGMQVQYFRSLPLHSSQKEVETHDDYSVFSYFLTTDYDFKQDILSFGDKVEVLEPKELRDEMKRIVKDLNKIYLDNMKINDDDKLKYLESMIQPYEKKNKKKYFIEQFLDGSGNELENKFWELKSSSRMTYDLYSWMKDDDNIKDFEFEFKLPGLKSGGFGPNMDVFIETKDELIFIESKFTEKAKLHYIDNGSLSEAYYIDEKYGKKQLEDRFDGNKWAKKFSDFCINWEELMKKNDWHKGIDWFEPKQETCHLSGLLLFLFNPKNKKRIKDKKVRLYNIFWKIGNDKYSDMEYEFCKNAQNLINEIIEENNPGIIDFKIDAFSVQEMLDKKHKLSEHIQFPDKFHIKINDRNNGILEKLHIENR